MTASTGTADTNGSGRSGPALPGLCRGRKDFDADHSTVTIRGRFILEDGKYTSDFAISRAGGAARSFSVPNPMTFGDYHTGDGYIQDQFHFVFHPMWVEPPGNEVHYGTIVFNPFGPAKVGAILTKMKPVRNLSGIAFKPTVQSIQLQEEHLRERRRQE